MGGIQPNSRPRLVHNQRTGDHGEKEDFEAQIDNGNPLHPRRLLEEVVSEGRPGLALHGL